MAPLDRRAPPLAGWLRPTGLRRRSIPHRLTEARLSAVVHRSTDVAIFFECDGTIAWVSPASYDVFGVLAEHLVGRCGSDLIHPDDLSRVVAEMTSGLAIPGSPVSVEFRLNDPDGPVRWVEEIVTDFTRDPDVGFIVGNLRDITERKVAERAMTRLALVDDLTGLPNRTALVEAVRKSEGTGDRLRHVGLVLFDLDDFCDVNDTLGHDVGDALLIAVARRVRAALPADHLVARFSGDQFAVLSATPSNVQTCRGIARRVQASLSMPLSFDGHELMMSATSGLALAPAGSIRELIRHADAALSEAKKTGRGGTVTYRPELEEHAVRRLRRTGELRLAVNRREIVPHYQPVIDLATGRVVGVEALARWRHPEAGWVPPDEFMPLAEATGLIGELGAQLITQSCADAARWLRGGRRLQVAVNASGVQLVDPTFVATVDAALAAARLPSDQLTIEITETAAMRCPTMALMILTALSERGILLALDDFGTGYSPLTALRDLPAGAIKLDRTFVAGLGQRSGDDLAAGIIQLGFAAGMHVVAEGIETISQADQLLAMGCQFGQGYLWSSAVAASDLLATVERIERLAVVETVRADASR